MGPARSRALVYDGQGASARCVAATVVALASHLAIDMEVRTVSARELTAPGWEIGTALLVLPGGADLPYCADLHGEPCSRIRRFVEAGGAYLGLCAGSYFGAATCEFKGSDATEAVVGPRELAFFPGAAVGPVFGGFAYHSAAGARAARVRFVSARSGSEQPRRSTSVYFEGGCRFELRGARRGGGSAGGAGAVDVTPLAWYDEAEVRAHAGPAGLADEPVAAVACTHGSGIAVLCGVHPELSHAYAQVGLPGGLDLDEQLSAREGEPDGLRAELRAHALGASLLFRTLLLALRLPVQPITIVGYGALLSERSSRLTFQSLGRFRPVRVRGVRRVFAQPHLGLAAAGLLEPGSLAAASLAVEPCREARPMLCSAFDVELSDDEWEAFALREASYVFARLAYSPVDPHTGCATAPGPRADAPPGAAGREPHGLVCLAGDDAAHRAAVGARAFDDAAAVWRGTVWAWPRESGLAPAAIYLRHCLLAARALGRAVGESFEETVLVDRETTVGQYLTSEAGRDALLEGERAWSRLPEDSVLRVRFGG
jgi:glutamine amidotransferase-like uncharacterized protein